jgi:hypothetical protein
MKVKTGVKGGRIALNRCETSSRRSMKVKTSVRAGLIIALNRCETYHRP